MDVERRLIIMRRVMGAVGTVILEILKWILRIILGALKLVLGLARIIPVSYTHLCQIVDEDCRTIVKATLDYFSKNNIPYFHRATHKGYLRHLLVRKATKTGEIIVDLVTTNTKL